METLKFGELPDMLRPLRVLVADDIETSRLETIEAVESLGHFTICCDSGATALAAVASSSPDIVLLDLLMPDMDGYEVTRQIRQTVPRKWLPVVVTSGLHGERHFVEALTLGADDYLPRPVNRELLRARLSHYQRVLALNSQLSWMKERERLAHEYIPDAVFTCDRRGRLCGVNRAAREMLVEMGRPDSMGEPLQSLLGILPDTAPVDSRVSIAFPDGTPKVFSMVWSAWICDDEPYTTIVLRDRSEDQKVDRMKEEFLATVSHELRTPLTSIVGAIGILHGGALGDMPPKAKALLQMAQRNGERLSRLIDDVMDLTKLEGDRIHLTLRPVSLAGLLRDALDAMSGYALKSNVQLALHLQTPDAVARADGARLSQVMANLLSNAIKHAPPGSTVDVLLRGDAVGWGIDVHDHGPGVPKKFRDRLFEKFSQADGSDGRQNQGTGLGLYISRALVRRMGGDIRLDQDTTSGAKFTVLLRAADAVALPTLVVSRDLTQRARFRHWIANCGPVCDAADLAGAVDWIARHGPVAAVVADLTAQGGAAEFFAGLSRLCQAESIVLAGDAADRAFADAQGAVWVAPGPSARAALVKAVDQARQKTAARDGAHHA